MTDTAIILAGGFGTRLKTEVSDKPKALAPVYGQPFLSYLLRYLHYYGIKNVIVSTGYLGEKIVQQYHHAYMGITLSYSHEKSPLGTGGGLRKAMMTAESETVIAMNGDSFFDFDVRSLIQLHRDTHATFSVALRRVDDASRYGSVEMDPEGIITAFREKSGGGSAGEGLINSGVYAINRNWFLAETATDVAFSLEKEFFPEQVRRRNIHGFAFSGYFIDIGVPEDFRRAQNDFTRFKY